MSYEEAERALLKSLRDGRGFVSNYRRGDARGARFYYRELQSERRWWPGRSLEQIHLPGFMHVELPERAQIRLVRDGNVVASSSGRTVSLPVREPGVYRIEAYRKRGAWVYTNPFRLLPPGDGQCHEVS
jgi:hypothetical protein